MGCQRLLGGAELLGERHADDGEIADHLAARLLLDLVDEALRRPGGVGTLTRSHSPSNRPGMAAYSSGLMVTMPVTCLMVPS